MDFSELVNEEVDGVLMKCHNWIDNKEIQIMKEDVVDKVTTTKD